MSTTLIHEPATLGDTLELRRLRFRLGRLKLVLAALEERRRAYAPTGAVPRALELAIRDFERERARLGRRLSSLAG